MPVRQIYRFVRNQYEKRFNSSKKESSANPGAPADETAPEAGDAEQAPVEEVAAEAAPEAEAEATTSK
ncbi:Hypothetical protein PP7435_CHR2-2397 [Komagataella phaffii CBS 7435]|uniref:Uncharacterized protein n=1 Tax=Komagataella phaffii (strain ATCC 76273 / CBS 7435 / CECT 11047 / NRRL Y-11430 / Wegner 21-1) TaxID=981350 RepID=A0A1G4KPY7_KOMPC|nr:Hypothetical protein BQ9382_C2-4680 [Komagataella phaffii CBS 7435]SCV12076.1 Hypothetical protein PP7435_CHR2-2397 [Komagataella phaffii CBS 7435]